jgi:hypothetical protein
MAGSVADWSGKDAADGASWLVDQVADMGFNAIWFSPMGELTGVEKISHGQKLSGSYYAVKNHFKLDDEFSAGKGVDADKEYLRHFAAKAKEKGVHLYADLVCNHVAADHPLVFEENDAIAKIIKDSGGEVDHIRSSKGKFIGLRWSEDGVEKEFYFKFRRKDDDLGLQIGGPAEDPWSDVAHINYSSPEAKRFFIFGDDKQEGYFKKVIDWSLDVGFTDFRCDAGYLIPPDCWEALINHAHSKSPDAVFMAETLTTEVEKVDRLAKAKIKDANGNERPAFDLGMHGIYWWNFRDDWLPKAEAPRVAAMSKFGGAGSPDNHDTDSTIAGSARKAFNHAAKPDDAVAGISIRDYAVALLSGNSSYMQMGYELCNEKQNHVFKGQVSPADYKNLEAKNAGTVLDLRDRIRALNDLHESLGVENCRAVFKNHTTLENDKVIGIHIEYRDADTDQLTASIALLLNRKPEKEPVPLSEALSQRLKNEGLQPAEGILKSSNINDIMIFHSPLPSKVTAPTPRRRAGGPKL